MKPEQFIREYGVDKAREVVEDAPNDSTLFRLGGIEEIPTYLKVKDGKYWRYSWRSGFREACQSTYNKINDAGELVSLSDLKRLVESLDIIWKFGSDIDGAKQLLEFVKDCESVSIGQRTIQVERLVQAIRDHESIYGGGDETN
ncbi:hypothetical protein EA709_17115 [Acinetobacter baumannii]|uniref:hypothetical protein n=1 Tax=Acinetobacter baumannii TaxID=470 RepID=UPI0002BADA75|nr:hypothetical protein [Acinetobacter baumannii]RSQ24012.1 hypothetical protein EA709_17115 [Acinetobacter baumannii]